MNDLPHHHDDTYTSGTLTETWHYYDTPGWQCVEERVGTGTTLERQFVWGVRYIDDLILRDRSTANNGVINERGYAMQDGLLICQDLIFGLFLVATFARTWDGNWNTVANCDITGFVGERYAYSAYGSSSFVHHADSTKRCATEI